jgi:TonB dependent receptor
MESFLGKKKELEAAVSQVVSAGDTPEVKLRKIYERVEQIRNLSYEARKSEQEEKRDKLKRAENAADVLKNGYGNGADITWTFMGLARAAGLETYGLMISRRNEYFFNEKRMNKRELDSNAVMVKVDGKEMFFDPGSKFVPYGLLPWEESGVKGMKLDKEGGTWIATIWPESTSSQIQRTADLKLNDEGTLEGTVKLAFTGLEGWSRRVRERNEDSESRKKYLEEELKAYVPMAIEAELTNQPDWKVDWTPNDRDRINGFYSQGTGSDFTTAILPVSFPSHSTYPTKIFGASWVHTFTPAIINEFRMGFTRVRWNNGVPSDPSGLFGLDGNKIVGIPFGTQQYVGFTGQSIGNNASYIGTSANPQVFTDNTFNYYDNLTWQIGRHYLSIGGQATRYQQNYLNAGNVGFLGTFSYNGIYTGNPNAADGPGYGPADFVLGRISNVQLASPLGFVGNRQWRLAGYFQDDFKVTSRLTLNLGLRYEYDQPWYEQNDKTANVLPNGTVEYAGKVPALAVPGSIVCPTRACYNATYNQIMPRLGFAFQFRPKLVIRGGYGTTSFFEGYSFNQRLTSSPPFSLAINSNAVVPTNTSGGTPFSVANAFSQPLGINNSLYSVWPQDTQPAYIHQLSLATEYAITSDMSLSVGYHGQFGNHLADYRNGNQLTLAQAQIATPILNASGGDCTVPFPAAAQPQYYPLVGECGLILITESEARMTYNSAQVTLRQRTHRGLEYTLNYTFAKSLTNSAGNYGVANSTANGSSAQNSLNLDGDYGPSGFDIRHSLSFIGVYELPFGRGKSYGSNVNGFVDGVLGGWKVSISAFAYSGFPLTLYSPGQSNTFNTFGLNRPNVYRKLVIRNSSTNNWFGTDPSATPCLTGGVDNGTCAFGIAGQFTFGTAGNGIERGPGYRQVDASFFKDFHLWREQVFGFRADFFNIFNIASYGNPDTSINDSNFGQINSVRSPPRQIQLSLHYRF